MKKMNKTLSIMKYAKKNTDIHIFIVFFLFFSGFVSAQNDLLEKRVTIAAQKEPLENVLTAITKQTAVRFSYNSQLLNPKREVTITAQNKTIKEILPKILPQTVSYKKVGEHIVLLPKKTDEKEKKTSFSSNSNNETTSIETTSIEKNISSDNGKAADNCPDSINFTKEEDMKAQIAGLILAIATASTPVAAQEQDTVKTPEKNLISITEDAPVIETTTPLVVENEIVPVKCKPIQLTFFYPLGSGWVKSAENCYHLSINILGGKIGQLKGFEMGGLFNINQYGAVGAQFAGLFNIAGAKNPDIYSFNAQFAGIFNHTKQGKTVQFAGIANHGDTAIFQTAGIFNIANKTGAQFAGIFNIGETAIFQAAGIFNIANKTGAQFAGIFNHAKQGKSIQFAGIFNIGDTAIFQAAGIWNKAKHTKCQLAGIANIAQESICQIAGIVNITKKGRFQMGLINVRDTADGVSLGLINIVKKGGILEAGIEAGEFVHTAVTFRSGVQRLYSIIYIGGNYTEKFWTVGYGFGTSFKLIGNLELNLELTHAQLYNINHLYNIHHWGYYSYTKFSPILNYRIAKHFKIYLGPSLNLCTQPEWSPVKIPYSIYQGKTSNQLDEIHTHDLWIGIVGGIKF